MLPGQTVALVILKDFAHCMLTNKQHENAKCSDAKCWDQNPSHWLRHEIPIKFCQNTHDTLQTSTVSLLVVGLCNVNIITVCRFLLIPPGGTVRLGEEHHHSTHLPFLRRSGRLHQHRWPGYIKGRGSHTLKSHEIKMFRRMQASVKKKEKERKKAEIKNLLFQQQIHNNQIRIKQTNPLN